MRPHASAGRPRAIVDGVRLGIEHDQARCGLGHPLLPPLKPERVGRVGVVLVVVGVLVALLVMEVGPGLPPHLLLVQLYVRAIIAIEHSLVADRQELPDPVALARSLVERGAAVAELPDPQLLLDSPLVLQPIQRAVGVPENRLHWVQRQLTEPAALAPQEGWQRLPPAEEQKLQGVHGAVWPGGSRLVRASPGHLQLDVAAFQRLKDQLRRGVAGQALDLLHPLTVEPTPGGQGLANLVMEHLVAREVGITEVPLQLTPQRQEGLLVGFRRLCLVDAGGAGGLGQSSGHSARHPLIGI
mmetsp:Transcript_117566/g.312762  ORF Transcript_117566/g.312762 Transcript_117566/m.312762 type:complete len:299 (+) Transcript_117566:314-1210(+)